MPMALLRFQNHCLLWICNFLNQVFRLAQLMIQYLVHCQQQLSDQLAVAEEQRKKEVEEKEKATSFADALEQEVKALRKENKKRRKMLTAQQECIFKGTNLKDFQKCSFCPKTFINQSFLTSHLARRHGHVAKRQVEGDEGDQIRQLVRSMKEELTLGREGRMEELTSLVRRQQEQMERLQETLKEKTEGEKERRREQPREEVEGRMEAQERFWQAQVKTLVIDLI